MARILVGVSGGIAAYKIVEFVRLAIREGHSVRIVMTPSARKFVGAWTFEGITGAPVLTSEFERDPMRGAFPGQDLPEHDPIGHLEVAGNADLFLVAPASANTLAKLSQGMADSLLTTSFLACGAPRVVAPAMNDRMLADPATRANIESLRDRGVIVVEPAEGDLASRGEYGKGRLPEPDELLAVVHSALSGRCEHDLAGLDVLVTAGGTREPIDGVRFIGNRSSGRMGRALAEVAAARGARVVLIEAPSAGPRMPGVESVAVETTGELAREVLQRFPKADVLLMAAAPADFRPTASVEGKLPRSGDVVEIELTPTEDILSGLSRIRRSGQTVVGFAAEWGQDGEARAREKLREKGADAIVLNDVSDPSIGFDSSVNEVLIVESEASKALPRGPKREVAGGILDRVVELRRDGRE